MNDTEKDKEIEIETIENLEHHAYLTVDEPDDFGVLFDKGAIRLSMDLSGRRSIEKRIERDDTNLGIKVMMHRFVEIHRKDLTVENKTELYDVLKTYRNYGAENLFAIKLVIEWKDGDMNEWNRVTIQTKDKEINRASNSQRLNVLSIPYPTIEGAERLKEKYGNDLVNCTKCLKVKTTINKRVCIGTLTGE